MMFVIIRTSGGKKYAKRIGQELKRINPRNKWIIPSVNYFPESFRQRPHLNPRNTLIHSRAAYPNGPQWMRNLVALEEQGYRVVNNTEVLRLTSNKLRCAQKMFEGGLPHPKTWEYRRGNDINDILSTGMPVNTRKLIVKPYTSMGQGSSVEVISVETSGQVVSCCCPTCGHYHARTTSAVDLSLLESSIRRQPTSKVIIQEYVPYTSIYRIIVIGGVAIPISWVDRPTRDRWKVSVCLNRDMEFVRSPDRELLSLAERTQEVIGGEINFIDAFKTENGYVLSEINTACNLSIHEEKARRAGSTHWNIAAYIAEHLDRISHN